MKQFKAESKRLLDLMINSIYTHREIFLRELISNASDAIDKLYYKALTDSNLSFNADDYFIKISVDEAKRQITISDTGIGMTEEQMSHIFEKYYQVEKSKTMQGLGLGLTIVNKILNLVNGEIEVTSKLREGSTFTVILFNE